MIFLTSPRTHLQTHSGEILMSAASWNMAGEPPEIILPVAANRAVSIYPKLWILNSRLSWLMKKSPDYSSAKKCDKMRQLENAWGVATGRSNAKNAVKSCVSQQFGAQKSIKVSFLIRWPGIRVPSDNQAPGGGFERQHGLRNKVIDHLTEIFKHWKSWW